MLLSRLHDPVVTVTATITNNGSIAGAEASNAVWNVLGMLTNVFQIPQLYTSPPASANSAPFNLKGFDSVFLQPGDSQIVAFNLSRMSFSIWDVISQRWEIPTGVTVISVGASSRDLRLRGSITN